MSIFLAFMLFGAVGRAEDLFDQTILAYSRNVVPDPQVEGQREAFRLYVRSYYGGTVDRLDDDMIDKVMAHLQQNPDAAKDRLGGAEISDRIAPIESDLARFVTDLHTGFARLKQLLTNPAANVGLWRKAKWNGTAVFDDSSLAAFVSKATPEAIASLALEDVCRTYAQWLGEVGVAEPARRAILANVTHYVALASNDPRGALRANDRRWLLKTLGAFVENRTRLNQSLGAEIDAGTSAVFRVEVAAAETLGRKLDAFRAVINEAEVNDWTLRPLTEAEAALRSLLARDCATTTYFDRAFDPAYYYFTRTERTGHSWGHLTVVLGRAWHGARRVRTAFVDKIQGIAVEDLAREIEALRQITARAGYELVLPVDLGDNDGISNDVEIRDAVKALPAFADSKTKYRRFRAETSRVDAGKVGASRAFAKLRVRPVLPLADEIARTSISMLDPVPQVRSSVPIDVPALLAKLIAGKHGTAAERVRYIDAMELARSEGLPVDPDFLRLVDEWARDRKLPIVLRFRCATYMVSNTSQTNFLNGFEINELRTLLSNWAQSRRMRSQLRQTLWLLSPQLPGDRDLLMANAFEQTLSEDARTRLVGALTSAPIRDEIDRFMNHSGPSLHPEILRIFVYLEAYLTARAENAPVTAELRRAALAIARTSFHDYELMLPPHVDYFLPRIAELLARPDLRLDATELETFFDDPENRPEEITTRTRVMARAGSIVLTIQGLVTAAIPVSIYEGATWTGLGLGISTIGIARIFGWALNGQHRARVRLMEQGIIQLEFPKASEAARGVATAVRACDEYLAKDSTNRGPDSDSMTQKSTN